MTKTKDKDILDIVETLKNKNPPKALFQCHIDADLLKEISKFREKNKVSWRDLVEACFRRVLEEAKKLEK